MRTNAPAMKPVLFLASVAKSPVKVDRLAPAMTPKDTSWASAWWIGAAAIAATIGTTYQQERRCMLAPGLSSRQLESVLSLVSRLSPLASRPTFLVSRLTSHVSRSRLNLQCIVVYHHARRAGDCSPAVRPGRPPLAGVGLAGRPLAGGRILQTRRVPRAGGCGRRRPGAADRAVR